MPDWLLTIPRLVWAPIGWADRRIRRRAIDRQTLVREGSSVVTPVIQLTKGLGPTSIMWGTDEENGAYLNARPGRVAGAPRDDSFLLLGDPSFWSAPASDKRY